MRFGIVGCGLIGQKRAAAIRSFGHELVLVSDSLVERAEKFAHEYGSQCDDDWQCLINADLDAVVVCHVA